MAEHKCKNCGEPVEPQVIIGGAPGPKGDKGDTPDLSPYAKKTDIPAKLPADGGNADTVDGRHASDFVGTDEKGTKGGIAQLDSTGKVPAAQLPSYVDDVLEYASMSAFPMPGETGKIYVATDTNLTYRWSGTGYVNLSSPIALGETSSTAYAGDKGKQNATDIVAIKSGTVKVGKALIADVAVQASNAAQAVSDSNGNKIADTYATKAEIPTKLPADGGNADTVDGKHAADFIPATAKGTAGGVAQLDSTGKVPAAQLPSYVDDVLEYASLSAFPSPGETGKIYVAINTNLTYRWSGTGYVEISPSIALGETSSTAYPGDKGKQSAADIAGIKSGSITVGKSNMANNLRSDKNFYLGYDGADGIDNPYVILGATATDSSNQSIIQRILPFNFTAGRAVNDENGNNIPKTYAKKDEVTAVKVGGRNYITGLRDNWEGGLVNSNGTITTGNNYNQVTKDYQDIAFLAGKTAIASVNPDDVITGSERLKLSFRIAFYTLDYLFISYESSDYNMAYKTLTVPDNAAYCKVSVGVGISGYVSGNFDKIRFQLELGNKETDYSPAPQDIPRINGEYPGIKVGKAMADGNGNDIPNTYAAKNGTYSAMTVGKANIATNLQSNKNFYLGYDGTDGTETPYVILGATGTDNYNQSIIKRIRPANLTVGKATKADQDGNGLNIQQNYLRRTYNRPGATWSGVGWRRIYIAGNADNPGGTVLLNIATLYWNTPSQLLSLLISVGPRDVIVQQFNGCYNYPIGKVRVCRKSNAAWCVDVYCNDVRNNSIYANQCGGDGYIPDTEMLNPSVDGYTVTEFDIKSGDRIAQKSDLPNVTYSATAPASPKNGDIWIIPTD